METFLSRSHQWNLPPKKMTIISRDRMIHRVFLYDWHLYSLALSSNNAGMQSCGPGEQNGVRRGPGQGSLFSCLRPVSQAWTFETLTVVVLGAGLSRSVRDSVNFARPWTLELSSKQLSFQPQGISHFVFPIGCLGPHTFAKALPILLLQKGEPMAVFIHRLL